MVPAKSLADWVKDLIDPDAREMALLELSKQREKFPALAPYLWNSFGTMAVLLQVCPLLPCTKAGKHAPMCNLLCPAHAARIVCRHAAAAAAAAVHMPRASRLKRFIWHPLCCLAILCAYAGRTIVLFESRNRFSGRAAAMQLPYREPFGSTHTVF